MDETEVGGMETEALTGVTIEAVALDGIVESTVMGTVHSQLVCAACERSQQYAVVAYTFI